MTDRDAVLSLGGKDSNKSLTHTSTLFAAVLLEGPPSHTFLTGAHLQWIFLWCAPSPHWTFNFGDSRCVLLAAAGLAHGRDSFSPLLLPLTFYYFWTTIIFGTPIARSFVIRLWQQFVCVLCGGSASVFCIFLALARV